MEPVTHFLTGACLGRSGFNRKTAYATLAMTLAAEAPDMDVFWAFRGPVAGLQHHRGILHTFIGAPFLALIVTGVVWLWHRSYGHRRLREDSPPVRWGLIWFFALLADFSHIFLDWTNNYGVRPFFPFNPHWYSGSFVFIFEPVLFAILLVGLVAPAIFGLADREIGVRRTRFHGQGWAIFALSAAVMLWSWRWAEHKVALDMVKNQPFTTESVTRISANPYPVNPFRWFVVVETKDYYQTAILNTRTGEMAPEDVYYKPPVTPAILAAKRSWLGQVFLDWAQFPLVQEAGVFGQQPGGGHYTQVSFQDLRFAYNAMFLHGRGDNPLGGVVTVAPNGEIDQMEMGGRIQH
ncbi:MAG TPA: metal-dependent hydrolase [Acidobacteriaceae bacterium]|jgi:inner membrane protein|nr:metal-dependent hydrolase [Acidobacteriaceae bacterium]